MLAKNRLVDELLSMRSLVGNTPVIHLPDDRLELFAKLEYFNLSGSLKDRPAHLALETAALRGEIDQHTTIIESSSGNFASALAVLCKRLGLNFIPVIDPNISSTYELFLRLTTSFVDKVATPDAAGGFQSVRIQRVKELCASISNSYWTDQYSNEDCRRAHYEGTGRELVDQLRDIDFVFIGVSSGGTIGGMSHMLKERLPHVKVVAVDVEGSTIFGGTPAKRYIPGIGANVRSSQVDKAIIDDVVKVSELATVHGCRELLAKHGVFAGGSSGSAYAAVQTFFANERPTRAKPRVAMLCADRGNAYMQTIYNDTWVKNFDPAL